MTIQSTIASFDGDNTRIIPIGATNVSATVNGGAATSAHAVGAGAVSISSPAVVAGDLLAITYTAADLPLDIRTARATSLTFGQATLNRYDEGVWTPASGDGVALTVNGSARYTRIGRAVHFQFDVTFGTSGVATQAHVIGLPFVPAGPAAGLVVAHSTYPTDVVSGQVYSGGVALAKAAGSVALPYTAFNGYRLIASGVYTV